MIMKNWKTTLIGLGFGVGILFVQAVTSGVKPKDALIAAGIAALGSVSKDFNVTGK
jgi:hypothetical protein